MARFVMARVTWHATSGLHGDNYTLRHRPLRTGLVRAARVEAPRAPHARAGGAGVGGADGAGSGAGTAASGCRCACRVAAGCRAAAAAGCWRPEATGCRGGAVSGATSSSSDSVSPSESSEQSVSSYPGPAGRRVHRTNSLPVPTVLPFTVAHTLQPSTFCSHQHGCGHGIGGGANQPYGGQVGSCKQWTDSCCRSLWNPRRRRSRCVFDAFTGHNFTSFAHNPHP